jgi:hypothetical protein
MSKQISLTLPDELMRRAELFADHSGRKVADVLTDAIEVSLDPFIVPVPPRLFSGPYPILGDWPKVAHMLDFRRWKRSRYDT